MDELGNSLPSPATTQRIRRWNDLEAQVVDALGRMRALVGTEPDRADPGPAASPGAHLIDVVHGSEGVWQAWWLHADPTGTPDVCAIVPDLAPFLAIAAGADASELADLQALLARYEVGIRLILPTSTASSPVAAVVVDTLAASGVRVRLGAARTWFFVSGDQVSVAPLRWGDRGDTEVGVFRGELIAGALRELFEHRWTASSPWRAESGRDDVLRLLATGRSDEEVADALGMSLRTVRRRVAEAMDDYGAGSRFELGYRYGLAVLGI